MIPTIGIWDCADDIDFDILPNQFVLKCTHDSGGLVICKNKSELNIDETRKILRKLMSRNYFYSEREWPYKNLIPRIIAEEYLEDVNIHDLKDYKFFCFDGKVKCFKVDINRFTNHRANYYDINGQFLDFGELKYPRNSKEIITLPSNLTEMIIMAEKLAKGLPFVRVDLYNVNQYIYFGEMTFYPDGGFGKFDPIGWDTKLGNWLKLPS